MLPLTNQLCSFAMRVNTDKEPGSVSSGFVISC